MARQRQYTAEFRAEAVRLARSPGQWEEAPARWRLTLGSATRRSRGGSVRSGPRPAHRRSGELVRLRRRVRCSRRAGDPAKSRGLLRRETERPGERFRFIERRRPSPCRTVPGARRLPERLLRLASRGLAARAGRRAARADRRAHAGAAAPTARRGSTPSCATTGHPRRPQAGRPADARGRPRGRPPAALRPHHGPRPRRRARPRPGRARLQRRRHPTGSGSPTSPTADAGRAGSTWRSSSTPAAAGSSAGRWPTTCAPSSSLDALDMALVRRRPGAGLVHHSDRGHPVHEPGLRPALPRGRHRRSRWARSATATTTPWPRASSPPSRPSSSTARLADPRRGPAAVFEYIEVFYNRAAATPPSATSARPSSRSYRCVLPRQTAVNRHGWHGWDDPANCSATEANDRGPSQRERAAVVCSRAIGMMELRRRRAAAAAMWCDNQPSRAERHSRRSRRCPGVGARPRNVEGPPSPAGPRAASSGVEPGRPRPVPWPGGAAWRPCGRG